MAVLGPGNSYFEFNNNIVATAYCSFKHAKQPRQSAQGYLTHSTKGGRRFQYVTKIVGSA